MEYYVGVMGKPYAMPDIAYDFKNGKTRREYRRALRNIKRHLGIIEHSSRYKNLRADARVCPKCGSRNTIGWGGYCRNARFFMSPRPWKVAVPRRKCKKCGATSNVLPAYLTEHRRYADKALRDAVDLKLWLYAGYRKVGRWPRVHGCSHMTILREIIKLGPICREALKTLPCHFSGIACIDEVYMRKVKGVTPLQMAGWPHKMDMFSYVNYPKCFRNKNDPASLNTTRLKIETEGCQMLS